MLHGQYVPLGRVRLLRRVNGACLCARVRRMVNTALENEPPDGDAGNGSPGRDRVESRRQRVAAGSVCRE